MANQPPGYGPPPSGYGYGPPSGYGPPPGYGYGHPQQAPPKLHPYATASLYVGLFAIFTAMPVCFWALSAVAGIPAILLGYHALRKISDEPTRFEGLWRARTGIGLGWTGCAISGFWAGWHAGHASVLAGIAASAVGLGLAASITTYAGKKDWGILRAIELASSPVLLLVGGVAGVLGARADTAAKAELCTQAETNVSTQLAAKNFPAARSAWAAARDKCGDSEDAKLADLDRTITQERLAAQKADAEQAAVQAAAAASAREVDAVATFPAKSKEITASYQKALNETYSGQWVAADNDLASAEGELASLNGTSVASTKDWSDMNTKLASLRQKLQPQLDRIAERDRKRAEAEAAKAEKERLASAAVDSSRGPRPENSAWDGSIHCIESYLKQVLNDPDSYQHMSTTQAVAIGPYWVAVSRFRAKNGFGALTIHQGTFKIQQNQVVDMQEE